MQANRDIFRRGAFVVLVSFATSYAACGDDDAAAPPDTNRMTASNQPGSGGGGAANIPTDTPGNSGGAAGSAAPGAAEAPRSDIDLDDGATDAGMSAGSGVSVAVDAACANDGDFDGTNDCDDACPEDGFKSQPGTCGCGVADRDLDIDGTLDCQDLCPTDAAKLVPGECGCGVAETDSDLDGALDCTEACPFDPALQVPGPCGCGAPANLPLCLRHRYSFDGAGAVATDSAGTDDGDLVNATLAGDGTLVLLGGVSDQYVNLPANIISRLGVSATIETWVTWTGAGGPWQRIFDFGNSDVAGQQGNGVTYLFVTPVNTINLHLRAAFTTASPAAERTVNGATQLPFGVPSHVAVVIDGPAQTLTMYQNGVLVDVPAPTLGTSLALLKDVNNWIGRSQFAADEEFQGVIDEVRIYGAARSAEQIAAEFAAGPNTLPAQ